MRRLWLAGLLMFVPGLGHGGDSLPDLHEPGLEADLAFVARAGSDQPHQDAMERDAKESPAAPSPGLDSSDTSGQPDSGVELAYVSRAGSGEQHESAGEKETKQSSPVRRPDQSLQMLLEGFEHDPAPDRGVDSLLQGFEDASESDPSLENMLDGFEDEPSVRVRKGDVENQDDTQRRIRLSGSVLTTSSFGIQQSSPGPPPLDADHRGLVGLRGQVKLALDVDVAPGWKAHIGGRAFRDFVYSIKGRSEYTSGVLDSYEREAEFQEVFLSGQVLDNLDLKVGRQIVVWGRSDTLRVLDVLNPLDRREPGVVDIADLRLPVAMTRVDYYPGPLQFTAIAIHESRFDESPVFGSEFYPFSAPAPNDRTPANGGSDTEYALALSGRFSGWDASLNFARYFNDEPHVETLAPLETAHARLTLVGASANVTRGSWLLKGELARISGFEFATSTREHARTDLMLGLEYYGLSNTQFAVEWVQRHLHGLDSLQRGAPDFADDDRIEMALRCSSSFARDTIHVVALGVLLGWGGRDGAVYRLTMDYDLRDALSIGIGAVFYEGGDSPTLEAIRHNDRLLLRAKYSF